MQRARVVRPASDDATAEVFSDLPYGGPRAPTNPDQRGGCIAGPLAVADQPEAGLPDRPGPRDRDAAVVVDGTEGRQVVEGRAEAGAPDDGVHRRLLAIAPDDACLG